MKKITISKFDPLDFFKTKEDIVELLQDAFDSQDPKYIAKAVGIAAKTQGMTSVASESSLNREQLYKSICEEGNLTLAALIQVLSSLGYKLNIKPL